MKKTILISIGALIIALIIGVWVYLFMYGTPKNSAEVFARFGIGGEDANPPVLLDSSTTQEGDTASLPAVSKKLKQLTLKPVAGATFTGTGILYVEQGTGHIYHLNFGSGAETLISGTTVPKARSATFSPGGTYVAITTTYGTEPETIVGSVTLENGTGGLDGVSLPLGARDVDFGNATNTLMYTVADSSGTSGYSYDVETTKGTQIFKIPLRDIRVIWGETPYVYTTPTATQKGYMYRIEKNDLIYVTRGSIGLMGVPSPDGVVVTQNESGTLSSYALTTKDTRVNLPLALIPEKCTSDNAILYCAVPYSIESAESFPDNWYKGTVSLSDALWSIDVSNGTGSLLSDFLSESGREVDVYDIGANEDGTYIYFINKNDNTLWMFDTTL